MSAVYQDGSFKPERSPKAYPESEGASVNLNGSWRAESSSTQAFLSASSENGRFTQRKRWALERSVTKAEETGDVVAITMARVRAEVLNLTHKEYSAQTGLSVHAIRNAERKRSGGSAHPQDDTFTRILADWEARAEKLGNSLLSEEIRAAKARILKELAGEDEGTCVGVLRKWRFEVGSKVFEEQTGLTYKTLWARRAGILRPFGELLEFGRKLQIIPSDLHGIELWRHPQVDQARRSWISDSIAKERPRALALLHTLVQSTGTPWTEAGLRKLAPDLPAVCAEKLAKYSIVDWKKAEPLLSALKGEGTMDDSIRRALREQWQKDFQKESELITAEQVIRPLLLERNLGPTALSRALGLPDDSATTRQSRRLVQRTISGDLCSPKVPFAAIAVLASDDATTAARLLDLRRGEVLRTMSRKGSLYSSPVQTERMIWGVELQELTYPKSLLQKLEWGDKSKGITEEAVIDEIVKTGAAKIFNALKRSGYESVSDKRKILHSLMLSGAIESRAEQPVSEPEGQMPAPKELNKELSLLEVIKAEFPSATQQEVADHIKAVEQRTDLRADNPKDRKKILEALAGLFDGSLTRAFYGDRGHTSQTSKERLELYELRRKLGFISMFHEKDAPDLS
ncbi:MAG: hypothetical protein J5J00_17055 [Deltaproteobacteria bacterium]|nr:hypothetical protein [Deltaproteobacteria bacterium]